MRIYTTYFAQVKKLPGSIVPIAISLYLPKGWKYPSLPMLAPTYPVFARRKNGGTWDNFARDYVESTLSTIRVENLLKILQVIGHGKDVALVCYEKNIAECHRGIVAEWLKFNNILVEELRT